MPKTVAYIIAIVCAHIKMRLDMMIYSLSPVWLRPESNPPSRYCHPTDPAGRIGLEVHPGSSRWANNTYGV